MRTIRVDRDNPGVGELLMVMTVEAKDRVAYRPLKSGVAPRLAAHPAVAPAPHSAALPVRHDFGYEFCKRTTDLVLGLLATIATVPLIVGAALISLVVFRTTPFFVQWRVGRGGKAFRIIKVRSLPVHAPAYAAKHDLHHLGLWTTLIRRSHIDELPQFWQVVTGHMSLVGPRPEMAMLVDTMAPNFAAARHSVRPGVTGLWQISEANRRLISETPEWDTYYLRNRCFMLDVLIMVWTALQNIGIAPRLHTPQQFARAASRVRFDSRWATAARTMRVTALFACVAVVTAASSSVLTRRASDLIVGSRQFARLDLAAGVLLVLALVAVGVVAATRNAGRSPAHAASSTSTS